MTVINDNCDIYSVGVSYVVISYREAFSIRNIFQSVDKTFQIWGWNGIDAQDNVTVVGAIQSEDTSFKS